MPARSAGPSQRHRRRLVTAIVLVLLAALVGPAAGVASAHGDDGLLTVTSAEQAGEGAIRLEVGIVYANDEEPAEEATVEATLTGSDGTVVGPTPVPNVNSGLYGAEIAVPATGTWNIAVSSTGPTASVTATVVVAEDEPTTTPSTTTTSTAAAPPTTTGQSADGGGAGGISTGWIVAISLGAVVVLAAALVPVLARRRRSD